MREVAARARVEVEAGMAGAQPAETQAIERVDRTQRDDGGRTGRQIPRAAGRSQRAVV
jgi:hypothetical protein